MKWVKFGKDIELNLPLIWKVHQGKLIKNICVFITHENLHLLLQDDLNVVQSEIAIRKLLNQAYKKDVVAYYQ